MVSHKLGESLCDVECIAQDQEHSVRFYQWLEIKTQCSQLAPRYLLHNVGHGKRLSYEPKAACRTASASGYTLQHPFIHLTLHGWGAMYQKPCLLPYQPTLILWPSLEGPVGLSAISEKAHGDHGKCSGGALCNSLQEGLLGINIVIFLPLTRIRT